MNPLFIQHAVLRANELMKPALRNTRIGSHWQNRGVPCMRTARDERNRQIVDPYTRRSVCEEWRDGWKCLRRRGPQPWLCDTFASPRERKYRATDCATYVRDVLTYAFERVGNTVAAAGQSRHGGVGLIMYLCNTLHWDAVYWNPDVVRPADKNASHTFSYIIAVKGELRTRSSHYRYSKKNIYVPQYQRRGRFVDIKDIVVQYKPNSTGTAYPTALRVWNNLAVPPVSQDKLKVFKEVEFGVVSANAGLHNALLISGRVYEAHWAAGPEDRPRQTRLYSRLDFENWKNGSTPWGSGVLAMPQGGWERAKNQVRLATWFG